jgi:hypothetical protein
VLFHATGLDCKAQALGLVAPPRQARHPSPWISDDPSQQYGKNIALCYYRFQPLFGILWLWDQLFSPSTVAQTSHRLAMAGSRTYRQAMLRLAELRTLDVRYFQVEVDQVMEVKRSNL